MLLTTGYLTIVDYPDPYVDENEASMRLPNREIRTLFKQEVMRYLSSLDQDSDLLRNLLRSMLRGNAKDFEEALSRFLSMMVSFYDTAAKESFYHGLVLGLLTTLMPRFEVLSNRESGSGRFDIAIFPGKNQTVGSLLEFKVAEKEEDLPDKAKEALAQIRDNVYMMEFENRGVHAVWQYGIAFCGKKCHIEAANV